MNGKVFTLILIIFGLLLGALLFRSGDLALMTLPFLAYLGVGILQSPSLESIHLSASRSVEQKQVDGISLAEVSVTVSNRGTPVDRLCLFDSLQSQMSISEGGLQQLGALKSGEETVLKYQFKADRGIFSWETITATISDSFGLIEQHLELPAEAEVQIQPELKKFRPFSLWPQRTLHSAGSIPARLGGSGTDFWGVREYQPGDALRHLDWRLTARYPHKFFTKEFEQEEIADVGLILDARQKTDLWVGEDRLFEHSVQASASLAEVFLRQGNRVSLLIFGEPLVKVYPGYGKVQLNRILRALAQATTKMDGSLDSLQYLPVQMFSSHSLILIISALAPNDWVLFPRLRAYGYQVLLISPDPLDFAGNNLPIDRVSGLAYRLARVGRQLEIGKIRQLWIPVIDWQVRQPLSPLVRDALRHTHIQSSR